MRWATVDGVTGVPAEWKDLLDELAELTARHNVDVWQIGNVLNEAYGRLGSIEYDGFIAAAKIGRRHSFKLRSIARDLTPEDCQGLSLRKCLELLADGDKHKAGTAPPAADAGEAASGWHRQGEGTGGPMGDMTAADGCGCVPPCGCTVCCRCCVSCREAVSL